MVIHGGGMQQHEPERAPMFVMPALAFVHGAMAVMMLTGQEIHQLGGNALRTEIKQQAAADGGHETGRNCRTQKQSRTQQQLHIQTHVFDSEHRYRLIYQTGPIKLRSWKYDHPNAL